MVGRPDKNCKLYMSGILAVDLRAEINRKWLSGNVL
jgi:hypothetical protein